MASRAEEIRARRAQDEEKFVQSLGRYPTTSEMMENDRRLSPGGENPLGRADEFGGDLVDAGMGLAGGMAEGVMEGGSKVYQSIADLLSKPDPAKESYDKAWHAPKVTSDQISDAVRPPVGQAYAKPLLNMQGDPEVERQMQAEAKGLMADEAGRKSWHPPQVMPNTPRDPQAEKRQQEMMKQFLANGGGPSYGMKKAPPAPMASIPESQNPFSKATATPDEMASASGQMMKSQIPQTPLPTEGMGKPMAEQAPGWSGNPDTMEYERAPAEGMAAPEMGIPEFSQDYGTDQDLAADPFSNLDMSNTQEPESEARRRLMEMATAEPGKGGVQSDRMALDQAQYDTNSQNRDLGFMQLLMRNANQMGTLGGVAASSKPFDEFASDQQKQNNDSMSLMAKASAGKQADKDERAKMLQFIVGKEMDAKKMQQDAQLRREGFDIQRQGFENAERRNNDLVAATKGRDANNYELGSKKVSLAEQTAAQRTQTEKDRLKEQNRHNIEMEKGAKEARDNAKAKAKLEGAGLPLEYRKMLEKLASDTASTISNLNGISGVKDQFDKAKTESEKINYARAVLKSLQSMEGPDAINGTDEARLSGYLNQVRPGEMFTDGGKVFGTDIPAFTKDIERRINQMKFKVNANKSEMEKIKEKGATSTSPLSPSSSGKVQVRYNGKIMMIPASRLDEAKADGAEEI